MLYVSRPVTEPTDIIPFLGKGEAHWRKGYSAYELAHSWVNAGGIPDNVRSVLDQAAEYRNVGSEITFPAGENQPYPSMLSACSRSILFFLIHRGFV
jgi:hypothetical protein